MDASVKENVKYKKKSKHNASRKSGILWEAVYDKAKFKDNLPTNPALKKILGET